MRERSFIISVFCFWTIINCSADTVLAFYLSVKSSPMDAFIIEKSISSNLSKQKAITFYDNFNHYTSNQLGSLIAAPKSDFFVPTDFIHLKLPMDIAVRESMSIDNYLSNMIYANLRLRQLIEEHRLLQQRVREALAGLDVPFINSQASPFPDIPRETASIDIQLRELNRSQQLVNNESVSSVLSASQTLIALRNRLQMPSRRPLYLSNGSASERETQRPLYLANGSLRNDRNQQTPSSTSSDAQDTEEEEPPTAPKHEKIELAYDRSDLPWIVKYVIVHPIESLAYFFILCFMISTLWSKQRRG